MADNFYTGHQRNGLSYGGYDATAVRNDKNEVVLDYGKSGRNDAMGRVRGMGAAAAEREAYQGNYLAADGDAARADEARGLQDQSLDRLRGAAAGGAPSVTTGAGNAMIDQSVQGQMGAQAGARGGLAQAAAAHASYQQAGGMLAQGAGQMAGMRAGELANARGAYSTGAGAMRQGDYASQGLFQQRATTQAEAEMAQRQLNQQDQMNYEGLGQRIQFGERNAAMAQEETDAGIYANSLKIENQEKNRTQAMVGTLAGAGGAGLAGVASLYNSGGGGGGRSGGGIIRTNPYGED